MFCYHLHKDSLCRKDTLASPGVDLELGVGPEGDNNNSGVTIKIINVKTYFKR